VSAWLSVVTYLAGVGTGVAVPILVFHYQDWLTAKKKRSDAARFFLRKADLICDHLDGIHGQIITHVQHSGFRVTAGNFKKLTEILQAINDSRDRLYDLRDDSFERHFEKSIEDLARFCGRYGDDALHPVGVYGGEVEPPARHLSEGHRLIAESIKTHHIPLWRNLAARLRAIAGRSVDERR
jgi:hypothetical protein